VEVDGFRKVKGRFWDPIAEDEYGLFTFVRNKADDKSPGIDKVTDDLSVLENAGIAFFDAEGVWYAFVVAETQNAKKCEHTSCDVAVYMLGNVGIHIIIYVMVEMCGGMQFPMEWRMPRVIESRSAMVNLEILVLVSAGANCSLGIYRADWSRRSGSCHRKQTSC
jgi:hypothetical protein